MLRDDKSLPVTCSVCNNVGFLQRNNSLEDKSRIVSSFKERQASKNLLVCENIDKESRFRRTETDFSNLYARDLLPAKNGEEPTMQFLLEVVDILLTYVRKTFDRSTKVLDFHHPHQLLEGIEGFNLELSDNPESLEQILVDCRDTLKYGVRTGLPCCKEQVVGLDFLTIYLYKIFKILVKHQVGENVHVLSFDNINCKYVCFV